MHIPHFFRGPSTLRRAVACSAILVLTACGGSGDTGSEAPTAGALPATGPIEAYTRSGGDEPAVTKRIMAAPRDVGPTGPRIDLGAVSVVKQVDSTGVAGAGVRRRIGIARTVPQSGDPSVAGALTAWERMPDGSHVSRLTLASPGARAVRLALQIDALPGIALVRVRSTDGSEQFESPGRELLAAIDRNAAAGDTGAAGRIAWLPVIEGDEATLEVVLPPGVGSRAVGVSVAQLSHLVALPGDAAPAALSKNTRDIGASGSCNLDVTCSPEYDAENRSTAKMVFSDPSGTYACTGTLMADRAASGTPYFLTANHCISTQAEASSLVTYWLFRSATCGSRTLDPRSRMLQGGASLLYTSASTDTTFLRLNGAPPVDASFAGSTDQALDPGAGVVAVHHPQGDLTKITFGTMLSQANCSGANGSCAPNAPGGSFLNIRWSRGTTESGSSGGALFATTADKRYVVGQLLGGGASCASPLASDYYGRFDIAYRASIKQWLDNAPVAALPPRTSIYRFYNATTRSHFFALGAGERDFVIATYPQFRYEGPVFGAYAAAGSELSGVARFYNATTGAHFYTIDPTEIAGVKQNASFAFEGERWFARRVAAADSKPVYRFYQPAVGNHFYTISESEKEFVRLNDSNWRFEGVGFHAWPQ